MLKLCDKLLGMRTAKQNIEKVLVTVRSRNGRDLATGSKTRTTYGSEFVDVLRFIDSGISYCDKLNASADELARVIGMVESLGGEPELCELMRKAGKL